MIKSYLRYFLVSMIAFQELFLHAAPRDWIGGIDDWNVPTNWSPNGVPIVSDNLDISNNGEAQLIATNTFVSTINLASTGANGSLLVQGSDLGVNGFSIGFGAGLTGTATVTGANSQLDAAFSSDVGRSGTGIVLVENGGFLRANSLNIGTFSGSNGLLTVRDPGSLAQNTAASISVGNQGTGELRVQNSGTVQFRNVHIGAVNGSVGTASVSGLGSTLASTITFNLGNAGLGTLTVSDGGQVNQPFTLNIGLAATGDGTLNLSGTPISRGRVTTQQVAGGAGAHVINFDGGILQATANNFSFITGFTPGLLNVETGGAFIDSNGFDIGTTNNFTGLGALTKIGPGTLILAGNNTNAGLNVDAGNLLATAVVTGPVNVNNTSSAIFQGTISGSLAANDNSNTINNGIVNGPVTTNGAAFFNSNNTINGSLTANNNSNALLNGIVTGPITVNDNADVFLNVGALATSTATVNNGGLFILGTLTGPATVNGGLMAVTGSVTGLVQTNPNGLLIGTGSVGELINGGRVSPGTLGSIGTFTVVGNHVNTPTGTHVNDLNAAGQTDLLAVGGTSTLQGGTLDLQAAPGAYLAGTSYTLITAAGGLSGQFANVIDNLPINYLLLYFPDRLVLRLGDAITVDGLACNARRVAEYINTFGPSLSGDFLTVFTALDSLGFDDLSDALDHLQPASFQALSITSGDAAHAVNDSFMDRLNFLRITRCGQCCDPCDQGGVWISGLANYVSFDRVGCVRGFDATNGGFAIGYDKCFCDDIIAGVGAGYSNNYIKWNRHFGHSDGQNAYLGVYATQFNEDYYADLSLLGFKGTYKSKRHIEFADIDRRAKSKQCNWGINPHFGSGLILDYCGFDVIPFGEIDYYYLSQDKFREHGANSLNLHVKSNDASALRLETGVRFAKAYDCGCGQFLPYASISYVGHRYYGRKFKSSFNDQSNDFSVFGVDRCFNQAEFGLGLAYLINDQFAINASYDIDVGSKRQQQEFNFELNYRF